MAVFWRRLFSVHLLLNIECNSPTPPALLIPSKQLVALNHSILVCRVKLRCLVEQGLPWQLEIFSAEVQTIDQKKTSNVPVKGI